LLLIHIGLLGEWVKASATTPVDVHEGQFDREAIDGDSGVEAAETWESAAQEREERASDGIVGVAQYVMFTLQGEIRPVKAGSDGLTISC